MFNWYWRKNREYDNNRFRRALTLWCMTGVISGWKLNPPKRKEK